MAPNGSTLTSLADEPRLMSSIGGTVRSVLADTLEHLQQHRSGWEEVAFLDVAEFDIEGDDRRHVEVVAVSSYNLPRPSRRSMMRDARVRALRLIETRDAERAELALQEARFEARLEDDD